MRILFTLQDRALARRRLFRRCWTALLVVAISGCRFSYEILEDAEQDLIEGLGGMAGDGDLAAVGGSGATAGSGAGTGMGGEGTGGEPFVPDLLVTTGVDEDDPDAMAGDASLSLREAIKIANAATGPISIAIRSDLELTFAGSLPFLSGEIHLVGNAVPMDLSGVDGICFRIEGGSVRFTNVEIFGCSDDPIHFAGGGGHVVEGSYFHDNGGQVETESGLGASTIGPDNLFVGGNENTVFVNSPGDTVLDNVFRDVNNAAVFVAGAAPGARVVGNQTIDCTIGIGLASNLAGVSIWHNTFVGPLGTALVVGQADAIDLRNNIFAHLALGLNASSSRFSVNDYNLFFENDTHCNACGGVLGDNSKIDEDPLFANYPGGNLALSTGSPAIDTGIFVIDRNQNGVPDMGALEF